MADTTTIHKPKRTLYNKSPWMSIHTSSLQNSSKTASVDVAEIDIDGDIGWYWSGTEDSTNTKQEMKRELKKLAKLDVDLIIVNISSLGGCIDHGVSIHDMLAMHKATVITVMTGLCASIATVIAQAGDIRRISDNGMFLAHLASYVVWAQLNREDLKNMDENLEAFDRKILNIYAKRSRGDRKKLNELMQAQSGQGKWIDADETKKYGLVDEIFEPMQAAALVIDNEQLNKFSLPNINTMAKKKTKGKNDVQADIDKILLQGEQSGSYINPSRNQELEDETTEETTVAEETTEEVEETAEDTTEETVEETTEETVNAEDFKKMQNQLNSLVNTVNTLKDNKKTLEDKVTDLTNKNKLLNTELSKAKAKSTIVASTPGKENVNEFDQIDDRDSKQWDNDVKAIKNAFTEMHD